MFVRTILSFLILVNAAVQDPREKIKFLDHPKDHILPNEKLNVYDVDIDNTDDVGVNYDNERSKRGQQSITAARDVLKQLELIMSEPPIKINGTVDKNQLNSSKLTDYTEGYVIYNGQLMPYGYEPVPNENSKVYNINNDNVDLIEVTSYGEEQSKQGKKFIDATRDVLKQLELIMSKSSIKINRTVDKNRLNTSKLSDYTKEHVSYEDELIPYDDKLMPYEKPKPMLIDKINRTVDKKQVQKRKLPDHGEEYVINNSELFPYGHEPMPNKRSKVYNIDNDNTDLTELKSYDEELSKEVKQSFAGTRDVLKDLNSKLSKYPIHTNRTDKNQLNTIKSPDTEKPKNEFIDKINRSISKKKPGIIQLPELMEEYVIYDSEMPNDYEPMYNEKVYNTDNHNVDMMGIKFYGKEQAIQVKQSVDAAKDVVKKIKSIFTEYHIKIDRIVDKNQLKKSEHSHHLGEYTSDGEKPTPYEKPKVYNIDLENIRASDAKGVTELKIALDTLNNNIDNLHKEIAIFKTEVDKFNKTTNYLHMPGIPMGKITKLANSLFAGARDVFKKGQKSVDAARNVLKKIKSISPQSAITNNRTVHKNQHSTIKHPDYKEEYGSHDEQTYGNGLKYKGKPKVYDIDINDVTINGISELKNSLNTLNRDSDNLNKALKSFEKGVDDFNEVAKALKIPRESIDMVTNQADAVFADAREVFTKSKKTIDAAMNALKKANLVSPKYPIENNRTVIKKSAL